MNFESGRNFSFKKVLLVSNSSKSKSNYILDALKDRSEIELKVEHQYISSKKLNYIDKIFTKLRIPLDRDKLNERIINCVRDFQPDVVFIIKGNVVFPSTLNKIKNILNGVKLVSWSQDDMFAIHNRSIFYTLGLKLYDLVVTQKSYNLNELKKLGAKTVLFQNKSYSKKHHIPNYRCNSKDDYKYDVLFIGYAERFRFDDMNYLASNGIIVHVFGSGWEKSEYMVHSKNLIIENKNLLGDDYSTAISSSKITLCFLRKLNRDLQTSRTIEIPACGGFMIAERTNEHKLLFTEDKEAIYFSDSDELLEKVNYYLAHKNIRSSIAKAGYERTRYSDYSYDNKVDEILKVLDEN